MKKNFSFSRILFSAFLLIAIIILSSALILEHSIFTQTFGDYLQDQSISEDLDWVSFIETSLAAGNDPTLNLQRAAMMNDLRFTFLDESGTIVGLIDSSSMGMGHMQGDTLNLIDREYPLENTIFAKVRIGRPETAILSLPEASFRKNLNQGYLLIGIFSFLLAGVIAYWLSQRVSKPIQSLEHYANSIANQNWDEQPPASSSLKEVSSLRESLIHLSSRLKAQNDLRQQLTTNMSHELRTPLNVLLNQIEAIHDGILPLTPERSNSLIQEVHRLSRMVSQIEHLNNLEQKIEKRFEPVNLAVVLHELAEAYRPLFEERKILFEIDSPDSLVINTQEDTIRQILFNLLENALRYTSESGHVHVSAKKENQEIQITIHDNGIGIPEEALPHIFDRFYRVDPARAKETGGSGLGLSIVKELLQTINGTITCESQIHIGTKFTIRLPIKSLH
ncbi:HAMP domain-containing sensor histidine kinase [Gottschalkiaceae bacterium SANA]|nr:HAMP domain-containing sensor histidine kinase [Gottschalkiaceae bacterium SANA]